MQLTMMPLLRYLRAHQEYCWASLTVRRWRNRNRNVVEGQRFLFFLAIASEYSRVISLLVLLRNTLPDLHV